MKSRVLVFPCGSEIGLEIHQALKWSTHIELFGASSSKSNHGKYVYKNYIEGIPYVNASDFINQLNAIIDTYKIDFVFPAHDSVALNLSLNENNLRCKIIGSSADTCIICRSKNKTYRHFKNVLNIPFLFSTIQEINKFPIFLKLDVSQGSKGTYIAGSKEEAEFYSQKDASLLLLEYLPGREYTVDCFTDRNRRLRFIGPRERVRISNGISVNTCRVTDTQFRHFAEIINNTLVFRGAWFFQVKERENGELVLLEIAPRIAGAMGYYRNLGINFPLLSVFDRMGIEVELLQNDYRLEMDRALTNRFKTDLVYQHVYIDLDDTIITSNIVNPWIIAYLYQCLNKKIKIHLITRTTGTIDTILKKYRLSPIFDSIIKLYDGEKKSDYIKERTSIFIDDSFRERNAVSTILGIPTFDTSSIESLLDWTV